MFTGIVTDIGEVITVENRAAGGPIRVGADSSTPSG